MATKIQYRRDTAANWTSTNPTLAPGEVGFETDTGYMKIGSGSTAWTSLPYSVYPKTSGNITTIPSASIGTAIGTMTSASITTASITTVNATTITSTVGAGFQNVDVKTSGSAATWTLPAALQVANAKFKVTIIGGGGGGGSTGTGGAGYVGAGGGGGGLSVAYLTYVAGQTTATYTVGAAGTAATASAAGAAGGISSVVYNSVTYYASGGFSPSATAGTSIAGGAGGQAGGGSLNIPGGSGSAGGLMAATTNYLGEGGNSALGYGQGGKTPATSTGANGIDGVGYGAGGSGGRNGSATTLRAGGSGSAGLIIFEY
jgi:hypothetical protein